MSVIVLVVGELTCWWNDRHSKTPLVYVENTAWMKPLGNDVMWRKGFLSGKQFQELVAMRKCHKLCRDANLWRSKIWRFLFYNTPGYRTTPHEKGDETSSPSNRPPCPQIDSELPMFFLALQREKRKKISKVFQGLPKLTQSWTEVFRGFSDVGPEN